MMQKLKWKNIIGYACINFLWGAETLISAWLMYFYTSVCNISPVEAGVIFTIARIIDAIGNPIVGFISDNFGKTALGRKFGRRRFFILIGVPLVLIVYPCLWLAGQPYEYYFVMNLLFEVIFTLIVVPGTTLPSEMTQDAKEKSKLVGAKQYVGTIASAIATFIPGRLFLAYGKSSPKAFLLTGIIYGVMTAIAVLLTYLFTFERKYEEATHESKAGSIGEIFKKLGVDISSSLRIKAFRNHCIMMGLGGIVKNLTTGVFTYFVVYVLFLDQVVTANISSFTNLVSSVALIGFIVIAYKYGGPKTYRLSSYILVASLVGYILLVKMHGSTSLVILLTIFATINTIGRAGIDYVPTFQLAFIADIDEAVTGDRREGIFNGVNSLLSKIAGAVESSVLGIGLSAFGFQKGVEVQSKTAVSGIMFVTIAVPVILLAIACISSIGLKLKKENHKILVQEVERLKNGGSMEDATPEARKAFKDLTGWDYDKCWGHNNVGYHTNPQAN